MSTRHTALLLLALCLSMGASAKGQEKYSSYLFCFFSDNTPQGEQIRYALSDDGMDYTSLLHGQPVVGSDTIALKHSIRDPHILRGQDGHTFYMVLTDMRSSEGWQSNDGLILMRSTDLIHWQHTAIDFPTRFPDLPGFDRDNLHAVWAPQTIWDPEEGRYMIYYSIGRHDWEYPTEDKNRDGSTFYQPYFRLYYSYANEDFTDITQPRLLFDFGRASIDGDIVRDEQNDQYVLFFKDEGRSVLNRGWRTRQGVMRATSHSLHGPWQIEWAHLQKPGQYPVEGSSVFPLIDGSKWILMYDCYANGYYQFCESTDLQHFTYVRDTPTEGTFTPRHGSVIHITRQERERLEAWSELRSLMDKLQETPSMTTPALMAKAQAVLDGPADTKAYRRMTKTLLKKP